MRTPHLFLAVLLLAGYHALAAPGVTTLPATGILDTKATLNAAVIPSGPTYAWFEYGTTTNYGLSTAAFQILNIDSPNLSLTVSNLSALTTYHYRAVATNSSGRTNGTDISFVSSGPLAITPNSQPVLGFLYGGVGFSFVPSVNLRVTKVGYRSSGNYFDPIVSFWSSNNVVGGYDFGIDIGPSNQMVFANYSLDLNAGQQYSIGFFDTDPSGSLLMAEAYFFDNNIPFIVAAQLTNYSSFTITTSGVFTNFNTNVFYLGANFIFELGTASPAPRPVFTGIAIANGNVTLTWTSVSNRTYEVESNTNLNSNTWDPLVPLVTASSNSATYTETFSDNPQRFYRVKLLP